MLIVQESPQQRTARSLAQQMVRRGMSTQPIRSHNQGLANLASSLIGNLRLAKADKDLRQRQDDAQSLLASVMAEPNAARRQSMLASNADTAPFATRMMLDDIKADKDMMRAKELEASKPQERWEDIMDNQGNIIGQRSTLTGKVSADPRAIKKDWMSDRAFGQKQQLMDQKLKFDQKMRESDPAAQLAQQIQKERLEKSRLENVQKAGEIKEQEKADVSANELANEALAITKSLLSPERSASLSKASGPIGSRLPTLMEGTSDAEVDIGRLEAILTKENLGLMKGVLSESDMAVLKQISAGGLDLRQGDEKIRSELEKIQEKLQKAADASSIKDQDIEVVDW